MNAHFIPVRPDDRPHVRAVAVLVHRYGVIAVVAAAVNLAFRKKRHIRRHDADLSDHIRRDVGLEPLSRGRAYWEL